MINRFITCILVLIFIGIIPVFGRQNEEQTAVKDGYEILDTPEKKACYAAGFDFGANFVKRYEKIDTESLIKGLMDAINGKDALMPEEERIEALKMLGRQIKEHLEAEMKRIADKNKTEGDKFLAENKKKEGVVTTESGLQYKIIKEGDGPNATMNDQVYVNYKAMLLDGTVYDSSEKHGSLVDFAMKQLIPAWKEALQKMKPGSKWILYAPSYLAYGEKGITDIVGPYATVIFELELVKIVPISDPVK